MAKLSLSRAWDESRSILARDGKLLAAVALAMFVLPGVVAGVVDPAGAERMPGTVNDALLLAAIVIIGLVGQLAVIRLSLGPKLTVGEAIGHGARRAPAYFAATILWIGPLLAVIIALGGDVMRSPEDASPLAAMAILIVLPILIYLAIRMLMSSSVASAEGVGPIAILKRSWELTRGNWWRLCAFCLLFLLVVIIVMTAVGAITGILASLVLGKVEPLTVSALFVALLVQLASGLITTVFLVMLARMYAQLSGEGAKAG